MPVDSMSDFFETLPFVVVGLKFGNQRRDERAVWVDSANACARSQKDVLAVKGEPAVDFVVRLAGSSAEALMDEVTTVLAGGGSRVFILPLGAGAKRQMTLRQRPDERDVVDLIFQDSAPAEPTNEPVHETVHESVLEKVLSTIPHAVFWKDRNSVYLGCNDRFMRDANLTSKEQIVGKTDFDMPWGSTNAETYRKYDAEMMASGKAITSLEETQLHSDGSLIHVVTSKAPLFDEKKQVIGVLGIYVDITELREAQSRVEEQQKKIGAISKMASLGEMASGIAHEINNPLAIIAVLAGEIREEFEQSGSTIPPAIDEHLQMIDQTTERIGKIIGGLRSFARNEAGTAKVATPAQELIDSTLSFCADKLRSNRVAIRVAPMSPGVHLSCRPTEISQVLINIINNACDAIAEQKVIDRWISVAVETIRDGHRIEISDSGPGVPLALRDKIFEPFFTTKKIGAGTGLGLSISAGLVKAHGGAISYQCDHEGSRFIITLPNDPTESHFFSEPLGA